jgi:hypothetical protein
LKSSCKWTINESTEEEEEEEEGVSIVIKPDLAWQVNPGSGRFGG